MPKRPLRAVHALVRRPACALCITAAWLAWMTHMLLMPALDAASQRGRPAITFHPPAVCCTTSAARPPPSV